MIGRRFFLLAAPAIIAVPFVTKPAPVVLRSGSVVVGGFLADGTSWMKAGAATPSEWNAILDEISKNLSKCILKDGTSTVTPA